MKRLLLLLVFLFASNLLIAQKHTIRFEHLSRNEGLSQTFVSSILQDSRGYMWFGTIDGLNKYDGYTFTVYKADPKNPFAISDNDIKTIKEDSRGNLWVGTQNGLNRFDRTTDRFISFKHNPNDPKSISSNDVSSIVEDKAGRLWIGTGEDGNGRGGLNLFDYESNAFTYYGYDRDDSGEFSTDDISCMFEDSRGNFWIGTSNGGLNLFDRATRRYRPPFRYHSNRPNTISGNQVKAILEDSRNNLWIGTRDGGLDLLDRKDMKFYHVTEEVGNSKSILSLAEGMHGNIWVGHENAGVSIFDPLTREHHSYLQNDYDPTSLNNNTVYCIERDAKGNMWLGTFSGGVNFFNIDKNKFVHYKQDTSRYGLSNKTVFAIRGDSQGNVLIGTDGGGLNILDPRSGTFTVLKHDPQNPNSICGNNVLSILEDSEKNIWIGTWGAGVTVWNRERNTFKHFKYDPGNSKGLSSNNAWAMHETSDGRIWIGTYWGGVSVYDKRTNSFTQFKKDIADSTSINGNVINSIFEDKSGNIWIGIVNGGLALYDKESDTFSTFLKSQEETSISHDHVTGLFQDSKGRLWVGTVGGLNKLNASTFEFRRYTEKDGLPHNFVRGILEDSKGNLWISTNEGITCFNPEQETFKNYTVADGLQAQEFKTNAAFKNDRGVMYFGGINGFNEFVPDSITEVAYDPPIVFTAFRVFNEPVPIGDSSPLQKHISETDTIVLTSQESVISFDFASLHYTDFQKKKYSYKLAGFDKYWNNVGTNRTAVYTNLNPGRYTLLVRGTDNYGAWSENVASMKIIITPPYWQTWWFRLGSFLALTLLVISVWSIRTRAAKKHREELERQVRERTAELQKSSENLLKINEELDRFAYVVSHDLKAPLRAITGLSEWIEEELKEISYKNVSRNMHMMRDRVIKMQNLIDGILEYAKAGRNEPSTESIETRALIQEVIGSLDIPPRFKVVFEGAFPTIKFNKIRLEQIFSNLLSNAVKYHDKATGLIKISYSLSEKFHRFSVADDGPGIPPAYHEKIFDIFLTLQPKEHKESTGVGLAIVKKIIKDQGGTIHIESDGKCGTKFVFTLPTLGVETGQTGRILK